MVGAAALLFILCAPAGGVTDTYYGDPNSATNIAEVEAAKVFAQIPEYQEIKRKNLNDNDPEYWSLLRRANEKFREAVEKVAQQEGYDAIVEKGTAKTEYPPDVTRKVINALPK